MSILKWFLLAAFLTSVPISAYAQSTEEAEEVSEDALLTQAELENLVAPVALYPDTLLIQILVASTNPMELVKADRLLTVNADEPEEVTKAAIEAEGWDESVEVLAVAFPEVIQDMAIHIEWTEAMGNAMLAQSDDVMVAVQTMRMQAINAGSLITNEAQTVEVTEEEDVIIQPADSQEVYVPTYDPEVVYVDNSNTLGDTFAAGLVLFGTVALIDEIFDDDDDWDDYWGCRNCGGWGGGPIYRDPDIDIDIDGNVNIGNDINIGNRPDRRPDGGWKPRQGDRDRAKEKIANRRDDNGKTRLPVNKKDSRADALRRDLSKQSGAPDISRERSAINKDAIRKTKGNAQKVNRPKASNSVARNATKSSVKKPSAQKNHVKKTSAARPKPKATKKHSNASKARKASNRGKKSGRSKGRRR